MSKSVVVVNWPRDDGKDLFGAAVMSAELVNNATYVQRVLEGLPGEYWLRNRAYVLEIAEVLKKAHMEMGDMESAILLVEIGKDGLVYQLSEDGTRQQ